MRSARTRRSTLRATAAILALLVIATSALSGPQFVPAGFHADGAAIPPPIVYASPQYVIGPAPNGSVTVNVATSVAATAYAMFAAKPAGKVDLVETPSYGEVGPVYTGILSDVGLGCGRQVIKVPSYPYSEMSHDYPGSGSIEVICPSIAVAPSETVGPGAVTSTYTVTPSSDFANLIALNTNGPPADETDTLTVDGEPAPAASTPGGSFTFDGPATCGSHQVTLTATFAARLAVHLSSPTVSASSSYAIYCPTVTLTPHMVSRSAEPVLVGISATGFHPGAAADISFNGYVVASGHLDAVGSITAPVSVAGLPCGTYPVAITETSVEPDQLSSSTNLTVSCAPVVTVSPRVVVTGMTTIATAYGFAGTHLVLRWKLPDGRTLAIRDGVQTTNSATGGARFMLVIPPGTVLGVRTLLVSDGEDTASAQVLAVPGSLQPDTSGQLVNRS